MSSKVLRERQAKKVVRERIKAKMGALSRLEYAHFINTRRKKIKPEHYCDECEAEFKTEHGLNIHRAKTHGH